jgi:hypothetical protein
MVGLNPASPPNSPPADEEFDPPSPSKWDFDRHFGYSPSPSPPLEVANLLTQEQIDMGMYKVEPGAAASIIPGNMGPPQPVLREEIVDTFKGRGAAGIGVRGTRTSAVLPSTSSAAAAAAAATRRKRKDRDSEGEEPSGRKRRV